MNFLTEDCPRCKGASITFDVVGFTHIQHRDFELFSVCRACKTSTVFNVQFHDAEAMRRMYNGQSTPNFLNDGLYFKGYVSIKDFARASAPEFLPENIRLSFDEGASCFAIGCFNAAGTMFRLCLDLASLPLLPALMPGTEPTPSNFVRRNLGPRLKWLFEQKRLPASLKSLASCVREDGNDGAHAGTLTREDAEDLLDFTTRLLERLYTEPRRIELAEERRAARRKST